MMLWYYLALPEPTRQPEELRVVVYRIDNKVYCRVLGGCSSSLISRRRTQIRTRRDPRIHDVAQKREGAARRRREVLSPGSAAVLGVKASAYSLCFRACRRLGGRRRARSKEITRNRCSWRQGERAAGEDLGGRVAPGVFGRAVLGEHLMAIPARGRVRVVVGDAPDDDRVGAERLAAARAFLDVRDPRGVLENHVLHMAG